MKVVRLSDLSPRRYTWYSFLFATSQKVAGSIPDGITGIFHWHITSGRTMTPELIQPLTKMSIRNISWGGKGGRCVGLTTLPPSYTDCLEIWEPQDLSWPVMGLLYLYSSQWHNRTRDLPICSAMPQATASPRNPLYKLIKLICSGIFRPCSMLPRPSTVNMNTLAFSETLLKLCQVKRRHVP